MIRAANTHDGTPLDGLYAGDDADAKGKVAELLAAAGYRPIEAGGLSASLTLEHWVAQHRAQRQERLGVAVRLEAHRADRLIAAVRSAVLSRTRT